MTGIEHGASGGRGRTGPSATLILFLAAVGVGGLPFAPPRIASELCLPDERVQLVYVAVLLVGLPVLYALSAMPRSPRRQFLARHPSSIAVLLAVAALVGHRYGGDLAADEWCRDTVFPVLVSEALQRALATADGRIALVTGAIFGCGLMLVSILAMVVETLIATFGRAPFAFGAVAFGLGAGGMACERAGRWIVYELSVGAGVLFVVGTGIMLVRRMNRQDPEYAGYHNRFVALRATVRQRVADIEAQILRRNALLEGVLGVAEVTASREEALVSLVAKSRQAIAASASLGERSQADLDVSASVPRVLQIVESYPTFRASASFRKLQEDLSGCEQELVALRQSYNAAVREYNTAIEQVPGCVHARAGGFRPESYFVPSRTGGKSDAR